MHTKQLCLLGIGLCIGSLAAMDLYDPDQPKKLLGTVRAHLISYTGSAEETARLLKEFNGWRAKYCARITKKLYQELMELEIPAVKAASITQVQLWTEALRARMHSGQGFTAEETIHLANAHTNQLIVDYFSKEIEDLAGSK